MAANKPKDYYVFRIPKKTGGFRVIQAPTYRMKEELTKIKRFIESHFSFETADKAAKGQGIVKNALVHIGSKYVMNMDIHKCFQRTTFKMAQKANYILDDAMLRKCFYNNYLPTGAPTSNLILNMVLREFDEEIEEICIQNGITYSRYVDDISISGNDKYKLIELYRFIDIKLKEVGYVLKNQKTRLQSPGNKISVTGLNVDRNKPTVGRRFIKHTKLLIKLRKKGRGVLDSEVDGRLNYIKMVQPEMYEALKLTI